MLCRHDYAEREVSSFSNQIRSEYYGGNISVYIEGIVLEHLSTLPNSGINSSTKSCLCHAVLHYFLLGDIKQDSSTTTSHRKRLIELLKERKVLASESSTIWENTYGCE